MCHFLPYLHGGLPHIFGRKSRAVRTLSILDENFHFETPFENCRRVYLFLHCEFYAQALTVRLSPYKVSIDETHRLEATEFLETNSKKLTTLKLRNDPSIRRIQVPLTVTAKVDGRLPWNRLCDVNAVPQAIHTSICIVGLNGNPAIGT